MIWLSSMTRLQLVMRLPAKLLKTESQNCRHYHQLSFLPSTTAQQAQHQQHRSQASSSISQQSESEAQGHVRRSLASAASYLADPYVLVSIPQPGTTDLAVVEPDKRIQPSSGGGGGMEPPGLGKRLVSVLRAVYHMLRRGLCRKRLMLDLHLLLGRGKLAGRALRNLVAAAHHHHHHPHAAAAHHLQVSSRAGAGASSSSSAADLPFQPDPRDVEFSCTTTPSYTYTGPGRALFPFSRMIRGRGAAPARGCDGLDFAQVARALEMMSAAEGAAAAAGETSSPPPASVAAGATPSPLLALSLGRSPAGARQLRVTDSPFPIEPEGVVDERANSNFDAFINKFYENLRLQAANATPDNHARRRRG